MKSVPEQGVIGIGADGVGQAGGGDVCKAKVSWVGDNGLEEAE